MPVAELHDFVTEALLSQETLECSLVLDLSRTVFGRIGVFARRGNVRASELGARIVLEPSLLVLEKCPVRQPLLDALIAALSLEAKHALLVLEL